MYKKEIEILVGNTYLFNVIDGNKVGNDRNGYRYYLSIRSDLENNTKVVAEVKRIIRCITTIHLEIEIKDIIDI